MNRMLATLSVTALMAAAPALAQSPTAPSVTNDKPAVSAPSSAQGSDMNIVDKTHKSAGSTAAAPPARMDDATTAATGAVTGDSAHTYSADRLINATVRNAANENVGDINDIMFDGSGRITGIVVGIGGFLGIGERNVLVPYDQLQLRDDPDGKLVVMSNLTKQTAKSLPEYKRTNVTK